MNKMEIGFPELGQIRKGKPKDESSLRDSDLEKFLRVHFYPQFGDQNEKMFLESNKQHGTLRPEEINFIFAFREVSASWSWFNEAYNRGRRIFQANADSVINWLDIETNTWKVKKGEPTTEFEPKMLVGQYQGKDGKTKPIIPRVTGRLKIVIPELGQLAHLMLKTTSLYDALYIDRQLGALFELSQIAGLPNGLAGIPFRMFRREQEINWIRPDGSPLKVTKWLINIEPQDANWSESIIYKMMDAATLSTFKLDETLEQSDTVTLDVPQAIAEQAEQESDQDPEEVPAESLFPVFAELAETDPVTAFWGLSNELQLRKEKALEIVEEFGQFYEAFQYLSTHSDNP